VCVCLCMCVLHVCVCVNKHPHSCMCAPTTISHAQPAPPRPHLGVIEQREGGRQHVLGDQRRPPRPQRACNHQKTLHKQRPAAHVAVARAVREVLRAGRGKVRRGGVWVQRLRVAASRGLVPLQSLPPCTCTSSAGPNNATTEPVAATQSCTAEASAAAAVACSQ